VDPAAPERMSLWAKLPPVLFVALVLHTAVLPDTRLFGVAAEAMLLLAVVAGIEGGSQRGAVVGFVAGLLADLFVQTPFGLSALAYSLTGYAVGGLQGSILRASPWIPVATSAVASGGGMVVLALTGAVVGQSHMVTGDLWQVAIVVAVLNGALSLVVVPVMRWAIAERAAPGGLAVR
jgi:rod shape-determining protein MreD